MIKKNIRLHFKFTRLFTHDFDKPLVFTAKEPVEFWLYVYMKKDFFHLVLPSNVTFAFLVPFACNYIHALMRLMLF